MSQYRLRPRIVGADAIDKLVQQKVEGVSD